VLYGGQNVWCFRGWRTEIVVEGELLVYKRRSPTMIVRGSSDYITATTSYYR
jgi:hypothetical protein